MEDEVTPATSALNISTTPPHIDPTPHPDVPWGKPNCSDCGKPREPTATQYSYCTECGRKRQRRRYRDQRAAAGHIVKPRTETDDERRTYLYDHDGKPGLCECCGQPEPDSLTLLYEGDPVTDLYGGGTPFAALCQACYTVLQATPSSTLQRLVQAWHMLQRFNLPRDRVLPDLNAFLPTTHTEQKSP